MTNHPNRSKKPRTLAEVIQRANIVMAAKQADDNPYMDSAIRDSMDHWCCTFSVKGQRGSWMVPFSMGAGHHGKAPGVAQVLDCLMSDASGATETFEGWCADYGYSTDSRSAERTYKICKRQTERAQRFFGASLFAELFNAERL